MDEVVGRDDIVDVDCVVELEAGVEVVELPLVVGVSHEYVWTVAPKLHPVESSVTLIGVQPTPPLSSTNPL